MLKKGNRAQLRWVILLPAARGRGVGKQMVAEAIEFARELGAEEIFLETIDGLTGSMAIYEAMGFTVSSDVSDPLWYGDGRLIIMTKKP